MLNREEYNATFKTNLTKEQFDEIMGKPITNLSAIDELALVDKNTGEVWKFVPKETAIPIEWLEEYMVKWPSLLNAELPGVIEDWRKENG